VFPFSQTISIVMTHAELGEIGDEVVGCSSRNGGVAKERERSISMLVPSEAG